MRKFTKSLMALAMLCVAGTASAGEEVHATFESPSGIDWNAETMTFSWSSQWGNQLHNIGLPNGNITAYEKLVIDCDIISGDGYRFMFYATTKGTTAGGTTIITTSGKHEYNLADFDMASDYLTNCSEICLSGYNASGSVKVNDVYLVKADDPLAGAKGVLLDAITQGKKQNSFAKTAASFKVLTDAISDGEAEYANASATAESLAAATEAITAAIAGLKLEDGYVNLTKSMFHAWSGIEDDATITGTGGCDLVLGDIANGGMLYGNASVLWNQYAKLVDAKNLIVLGSPDGITFGARTDRLEVGNGSEDPNGGSLTTLNLTISEGMASVDLSSKASVRINAIKNGWGGPANVTDLLVEFKPRAVTVGSAGYTTFAPDMNVRATGVTAYAAKYDTKGFVNLTTITEIPAGAGVIIEASADDYALPVINEAAAIDNDLLVSDGSVAGDGTIYALANGTSGIGFYKVKSGDKVPAGKAYLTISSSAREFIGFNGNETTGITNVAAEAQNNTVYNLAGQRVANAQKGLFIVNGKKMVIK